MPTGDVRIMFSVSASPSGGVGVGTGGAAVGVARCSTTGAGVDTAAAGSETLGSGSSPQARTSATPIIRTYISGFIRPHPFATVPSP